METTIGKQRLLVRNTKDLLSPSTRMCHLVHAEGKKGKTTLGGSLDQFTRKYRSKPTIAIAFEAAEGGGTATLSTVDALREHGIDYVMPQNHSEVDDVLAWLSQDTKYGGILFDNASDYVKNIVQPYSLSFPSREHQQVRTMGVPDRGDYQSMGEFVRQQLSRLVAITRHTNPDIRKDLVVMALTKDKTSTDGKTLLATQPALPGEMASTAVAMFQTVSTIRVKNRVVPDPRNPKTTMRVNGRVLVSDSDGVLVAGDRWKVLPREYDLTAENGETKGFVEIYEECWVPRLKELGKWEGAA